MLRGRARCGELLPLALELLVGRELHMFASVQLPSLLTLPYDLLQACLSRPVVPALRLTKQSNFSMQGAGQGAAGAGRSGGGRRNRAAACPGAGVGGEGPAGAAAAVGGGGGHAAGALLFQVLYG